MKEENFGPVSNPDGTPTELTKEMLAGTGRSPEEFATESQKRRFGPVTVITADGTGTGYLTEDDHLEMEYEDRNGDPEAE